MVAPTIDSKLYSLDKRNKLQAELNAVYYGINRTAEGAYSSALGKEAEYLSKGFAFIDTVIMEKADREKIQNTLLDLFGALDEKNDCIYGKEAVKQPKDARNFELVQHLPSRAKPADKENKNCFAVYIRWQIPAEPIKKRRLF